jgi:uncharacterized protein YjbI with pentapeptide repeats
MWKKITLLCILSVVIILAQIEVSSAKIWPPGSKIPADSIIAVLMRGEHLTIDSSDIDDELILDGSEISEDHIMSLIKIENCHFHSQVDFRRCTFYYSCIFVGCTFHDDVRFISVTFHTGAAFLGCSFKRLACFWDSRFDWSAAFRSVFEGEAIFLSVVFGDNAYFSSSVFAREAKFDSATFHAGSSFEGLVFSGDAIFEHVTFGGKVNFHKSTFSSGADFESATFSRAVRFDGTVFAGWADFRRSVFWGRSSFEEAQFRQFVNFLEALFDGYVLFYRTNFEGGLNFSLREFKNFYITWEQIEGRIHGERWWYFFLDSMRVRFPPRYWEDREFFDPEWARFSTYSKLIGYWEDERQLDDADEAYFWLKSQERQEREWYVRFPEYWLVQQTCGYGIKPERVFLVSTLIILFFAFFYTKSNALTGIQEKLGQSRRQRMLRRLRTGFRNRVYDALYFSFQTFIIGVVPDWHPTDNYLVEIGKIRLLRFRTIAMIEGALGWILLVLFVVTLTRKFIR